MSWGKLCGISVFVVTLAITAMVLPATSLAQTQGAVFVNGNSASNQVWMYKRATNGMLTLVNAFSTQGLGGGTGLGSQGGVALASNNKLLYAVNAGSNDITAFQVKATGLTFVSRTPSGGTFPNSVAAFGNVLYVLNSLGTAANITGFRIQSNGSLRQIPNSTRPLSADVPKPAQIGFSPDGKTLLVSEINTDVISTYAMGTDGRPSGPNVQPSAGGGPFGFMFDNAAHLIVSEVDNSSASSYSLSGTTLNVITGGLVDHGKAACWLQNTNNPSFPQQYSYITDTGSDSISAYAIGSDGSLTLLPFIPTLPKGAFVIDMALSKDSNYLYVLEGKLPGIAVFQINSDGSLVQIQDLRGGVTTSYGMTGF